MICFRGERKEKLVALLVIVKYLCKTVSGSAYVQSHNEAPNGANFLCVSTLWRLFAEAREQRLMSLCSDKKEKVRSVGHPTTCLLKKHADKYTYTKD
jgi:hypothetical protein